MASADTSFVSEHELGRNGMSLQRARIDHDQSFQLYIGSDDFSRTFFFRMPPEWSTFAFTDAEMTSH